MQGVEEKKAVMITGMAQAIVAVTSACIGWLAGSPWFGVAVLWGGMAALTNLLLLAWRMIYGDRPTLNAEQHLRLMYRSSIERFFVVTSLMAIGMLKLKLAPLGVIIGFLVGQGLLVVVPIMREIKVK